MLLEIRHLTQYLYSTPVHESVMDLWAQPQKSHRQRLISFELEVEPAAQLFSYADAYGNAVGNHVLENLANRDPVTLQWKPMLAESWTVSDDGLLVTFKLRKGVTFPTAWP